MGFALRKLKNTTPVKRPSKALDYAQKQRLDSKPHLHVKDNNFLNRLREIKITEVKELQHSLPEPDPPTPHEARDADKTKIPVGMLDIEQITVILANKRRYPGDWTKEYVSKTFKIREEHAEGLLTYFNNYVEPSAKQLKDPKSTKLVNNKQLD